MTNSHVVSACLRLLLGILGLSGYAAANAQQAVTAEHVVPASAIRSIDPSLLYPTGAPPIPVSAERMAAALAQQIPPPTAIRTGALEMVPETVAVREMLSSDLLDKQIPPQSSIRIIVPPER